MVTNCLSVQLCHENDKCTSANDDSYIIYHKNCDSILILSVCFRKVSLQTNLVKWFHLLVDKRMAAAED